MPRITGKSGQVYLPTGDGISLSNQALTMSASKTIQGVATPTAFTAPAAVPRGTAARPSR
jgi:hypothetical protein